MIEYVYLIGLIKYPTLIKIGKARNVYKRIEQLQTGNPFLLYVVLTIKTKSALQLEQELHKRFTRYHIMNEWYELQKEHVMWIQTTYQKHLGMHPSTMPL